MQNWGRRFGWCSERSQIKTHIKSLIERQNVDRRDTRERMWGKYLWYWSTWQLQSEGFEEASSCGEKDSVTFLLSLFCAVGVERRLGALRSLWCHLLFHSSLEIWSHYSSASADPVVTCQRFLLRPAPRTLSCLTLMDNPSSFRAQHAIWCATLTDRGMEGQFANAVFQSIHWGKTFIKTPVPFFLSSCHIICTVLSGALWRWLHFTSKGLHGWITWMM